MHTMLRTWPVIHLDTLELAIANACLASACGAHGVFVIHMNGDDDEVIQAATAIKEVCPNLRVGVNHLTYSPARSLALAAENNLDAMWTDNPGVTSNGLNARGQDLLRASQTYPNVQVFASVAFKGQPHENNPAKAVLAAWEHGWTATTSGPGTGRAADPAWIAALRSEVGDLAPLGLASGLTPENIHLFAPSITDALVATGIGETFYKFSRTRLQAFIENVRCR